MLAVSRVKYEITSLFVGFSVFKHLCVGTVGYIETYSRFRSNIILLCCMEYFTVHWKAIISTVTGVRDRWSRVGVQYRQEQHIFLYLRECTPARSDSSPYEAGTVGPFQGLNRPGVKLTTYKHAVPKLRMSHSPVPSTKNFTINFLVH
jgi:hypothetical protein